MDKIEIKIDRAPFLDAINRLQQAEADLAPVMGRVAEAMRDMTAQAFADEADPETGQPWEPLKTATIKARQKRGKWPGNILQVAGQLANSIHAEHDDHRAVVGTNLAYAAIHHFGGTIPVHARSQQMYFRHDRRSGTVGNRFVKKSRSNFAQRATIGAHDITIPARPFLGLSEAGHDEILGILLDHFRAAAAG